MDMITRRFLALAILLTTLAIPAPIESQSGQQPDRSQRLQAGLEALSSSDRGTTHLAYLDLRGLIREAEVAGDRQFVDAVVARVIDLIKTTESDVSYSSSFLLLRLAGPASAGGFLVDPDQLLEIFEQSPITGVRVSVLNALEHHPSRTRSIEILAGIAVRSGDGLGGVSWPESAVLILEDLGEPGFTKLRELHEASAISNPAALRRVEGLAKSGFRSGGGGV